MQYELNLKTNIEKSNHFDIISHRSFSEGKTCVNSFPANKICKEF